MSLGYTLDEIRVDSIRAYQGDAVLVIDCAARMTRYVIIISLIAGLSDNLGGDQWCIALGSPTKTHPVLLPRLDGWHGSYLAAKVGDQHAGAVLALVLEAVAAKTLKETPR